MPNFTEKIISKLDFIVEIRQFLYIWHTIFLYVTLCIPKISTKLHVLEIQYCAKIGLGFELMVSCFFYIYTLREHAFNT